MLLFIVILSLIKTSKLDSSGVCAFHYVFKGKSDVIVNCDDDNFKYNPNLHTRKWTTFDKELENKYPYHYLNNGSLLIKDLDERTSHYFCNVYKKNNTKETIHRCGTAVTIIYPVVLKHTPINETVENNTLYTIQCQGGGGDLSIVQSMFFIDDVLVVKNEPFRIVKDTKIECRVKSGDDSLSVTGYITVRRKGQLTDEENFLQNKCGYFTRGLCHGFMSNDSMRTYYTFHKSQTIIKDLLEKLFFILDNSINLEYYEDQCVDRFKRLVCSTFFPSCSLNRNGGFTKTQICRESCETIFHVVCRKAIVDIDRDISKGLQTFSNSFQSNGQTLPDYVKQFMSDLSALVKSIFKCAEFPSKRLGNSLEKPCVFVDLDISKDLLLQEKSESKCFNGIGRNFIGKLSSSEANTKCINWNKIPQLYLSFYQQNLENQSNFCRNPGGIYKTPMCAISLRQAPAVYEIKDIGLVPCSNVGNCIFILKTADISSGKTNYFVVAVSLPVIILIVLIAIVVTIKYFQNKIPAPHKKLDVVENIPLNNEEINIYTNKFYKHTQNGGFSCPIYNAAHFEKVQPLALGEYGEIILVQAVLDNINTMVIDEKSLSSVDKVNKSYRRQRSGRSISGSDMRSIDDLILSVDKTFNEKPCWPFDKSSQSGYCPFAVIKYLTNIDSDQKEGRFNKETKILSQLNHPNILRFYGICLHISNKVICRIVEYLPNGDIKSILTGRRRQPPKTSNHDNNNNKIRNGYQCVNSLRKNRNNKSQDLSADDDKKLFKRKRSSVVQSRETERPQPAEFIDLNTKQLLQWAIEICDAVLYMHTKHYIHRDIATRNCLVGINLEAKLADFSFVQKFSYGYDLIGNPNEYIPIRWLPKETLEDVIYNTDTDVWMYGVFLWELMSSGKDPYYEYELCEVYDAIVSDKKLEIPPECPVEIYEQMQLCFAPPRQRPCLDRVKNNLTTILHNA